MKIVNSRIEYLNEVSTYFTGEITAIELGVFEGGFSEIILDILKPKKLYLVDPFEIGEQRYGNATSLTTAYSTDKEYNIVLEKFKNEIENNKIVVDRRYSFDAVKDFPDNYFDFIYIDACHLKECVERDLKDYLPKLKNGGLICGHDFSVFFIGVVLAVNEFREKHGFDLELYNENGGDWALKKK